MTSLQCNLTSQHHAQLRCIRIPLTPAFGSPHVMLRRTPSATRDAFADCCPVRRSLRAIEVSPVKLYFSVTCNLPHHPSLHGSVVSVSRLLRARALIVHLYSRVA